jgi:hypothetical protein
MESRSQTALTLGVVAVLIGLGAADVVLMEGLPAALPEAPGTISQVVEPLPSTNGQQPIAPGGVAKATGPRVPEVLATLGFQERSTKKSDVLLNQIIPSEVTSIDSRILLLKGDRAGLVAWIDSPDVKAYFIALKEALHNTFSPQLQDLVDETQKRDGLPTRNILTFLDPALSNERLVFVRVQQRLYEFHVTEGQDEAIFELLEKLTE